MDTLRKTDLETARVSFRLIDDVLSCDNLFVSLFKTPKEEGVIWHSSLVTKRKYRNITHKLLWNQDRV